MAASKSPSTPPRGEPAVPPAAEVAGSLASTVSGPARMPLPGDGAPARNDALRALGVAKSGQQRLAEAMPDNPGKLAEYGPTAAAEPMESTHVATVEDDEVTASTVSEINESDKVGDGLPTTGRNPLNGSMDRVRVDSHLRALSTNQGVTIADNQHSLRAGVRGPTLLEDFILREKITHFDHERIPERVVHARGSAAHGYFECYESLADITRAEPFSEAGKRTPVFTRFSTVAGERGSTDTARDTRGFAVKFYTGEGVWDLVGNNIPVFFIQDAMKFPDLIHAVKPEPHHAMPQASSAHDTFWDFISLMPESVHHTLWVMSDRGIPRSYRTMQGFGVNTYRLVNEAGESQFVKFHWLPLAGTHSLVWDEAVKISGADPDFHRRDLWEAIETGQYPQYELALQVFTEEEAEAFSFDVLDPTKLVPEELVPLRAVGRMVLDRNPDNFFAETEQVAFCPAHVVPGIDFSNDPLLQGRLFSYLDTQLSRLGGPNFHELPINASLAPVHNNQRDGLHRQAVHRGRVAYEPNSLAGGCPYQAGARGFVSVPEPMEDAKGRIKPERFADHYSQAALFWRSQSLVEQLHIVAAYRFELSRVTVPAIRKRVVSQLVHVAPELAEAVADGLGFDLPEGQALACESPVNSEVDLSPSLSLHARPGEAGAAGRRVAVLAFDGADGDALRKVHGALTAAMAVPRFVSARLGSVDVQGGEPIEAETTFTAMPSVLWDAVVLPAHEAVLASLGQLAVVEFVIDQYRHGKPLLVVGQQGTALLTALGLSAQLPDGRDDPGVLLTDDGGAKACSDFIAAIGRHRHPERELAARTPA